MVQADFPTVGDTALIWILMLWFQLWKNGKFVSLKSVFSSLHSQHILRKQQQQEQKCILHNCDYEWKVVIQISKVEVFVDVDF